MFRKHRDEAGEQLWSRRKTKLYFDDEDLDVYLAFTLSREAAHSASLGEAIAVASQVDPRDAGSWASAWTQAAERLEGHADQLTEAGDRVGAHDAFLRASSYHRAAIFGLDVEGSIPAHRRAVDTFRRAAELSEGVIQPFSVSEDGWRAPGYFVRADQTGEPRPTLLLVPGGEMIAEDVWSWLGHAAARRGYHTVMVEPPGYMGFKVANPDVAPVDATMVSAVFAPLLDAVTALPEVDADRLVAVGYSGGGFLALRATARDPRIRALVADAPIVDFGRLMGEEMPKALLNAPPAVVNAVLRLVARRNPFLTLSIAKLAWQWGVDDLTEWFALFRDQSNEDLLDDIGVPVLALTGEGESAEQRRQAQQAFDALPEPKAFRLFSAAEGAEAHTQVNNPTLMQEVIFGWLAEVLQRDQIRA